jgi:hypothetical protein
MREKEIEPHHAARHANTVINARHESSDVCWISRHVAARNGSRVAAGCVEPSDTCCGKTRDSEGARAEGAGKQRGNIPAAQG